MTEPPAIPLSERVLQGDPRAVARAISLIEDESPLGADLVRRVFGHTGRAYLVGITGAPGAGKSTLVDRLITELRRAGRSVGVVAVDPTSPFTGGAILGDRVRMQSHVADAGVFIRSMATRGNLGGLARASADAALVLDASGKDIVLIETVGVGQDEVDIVRTADISIVTLVPGAGDEVQALKAGIMEIADIFVVNKADREGADRTVASVEALLSLDAYAGGRWRPPIVKTEATTGKGVPELIAEIERFRAHTAASLGARRRARAELRVQELLALRFVHHVRECVLEAGELERLLDRIASRDTDPYTVVDEVIHRALRDPLAGPSGPAVSDDLVADSKARGQQTAPTGRVTIDHVGIAVSSLSDALSFFRDALGLEVEAPEEVASQRVRAHFIPLKESAVPGTGTRGPSLELLEATAEDSPIAKYVATRGPGLHHITLRVDDIRAALARLTEKGVRLIDAQPREGAQGSLVAFVHPSSAHGVLVELKQIVHS
ncbi:MAG TPA: methylmalonyl Co-A mutase-associated GTPase MeaB [Vicinamibacterales bacterium]